MSKIDESQSVSAHFVGKETSVLKLYDRLVGALERFGPVKKGVKKTSIHLVNHSAFAGVQVRSTYLLFYLKSDHKIRSPRIVSTEQVSASRYHHKFKIMSARDIDHELLGLLEAAYELSG